MYSFSIIKQSKIQIYAFDITKEYLTTLEIENKQAELKVKQSEILKMIENLDEIERQKEVLTLKQVARHNWSKIVYFAPCFGCY